MADDQNPQDPQVPVSTADQSASSAANRPDSIDSADSSNIPADSNQQAVNTTQPPSESNFRVNGLFDLRYVQRIDNAGKFLRSVGDKEISFL